MSKRILHLTLKKKWFDLIASGEKTHEFREIKRYWETRLMERAKCGLIRKKIFDEIHFKNGYSKDAPFMIVKWGGMTKSNKCYCGEFNGYEFYYRIILGEIVYINRGSE